VLKGGKKFVGSGPKVKTTFDTSSVLATFPFVFQPCKHPLIMECVLDSKELVNVLDGWSRYTLLCSISFSYFCFSQIFFLFL